MKIAHISDVHIRLASRHKEYKQVFDNLIEDLKAQKPDLIVNTGDTVHNKVHLSPEVFSMMRYLYNRLIEIAPNIIIDGNHDLNVSNERRMSSVKSFVELFNDGKPDDKQLIYFEEAGIHSWESIDFYLYPLVGMELPDTSKINKAKTNIALYHGVIGGAKTDVGHTFKKTEQKVDIPHEKFDAVLLGDIHKHQYIKPNMAYASSLVQQTWGENPDGHGYMVWNFDDSKISGKYIDSEFREIENEYGYYKMEYAGENLLSHYKSVPPKATIKVLYESGSIREDIIRAVEEQYNVKSILLEEKVYDSEGKQIDVREDIVDVHNYPTQRGIVENYFEDDEHKDEILDLNEKLFEDNKNKFNNDSKRVTWVPEHIEFSNLFVYGEGNKFVFDNKQGVIGLFSPNTSGKSSFLDAIQFAIYGETARTSTYDDIINKQSKDYNSIIYLKTDNKRFSIQRSGKRTSTGWNNSITYKEYDGVGNVTLEEGDMREAKALIEKYFGDAKSYQKTSYIYQDSDERFLNLTPAKRKEWLYDNLGLEVFEVLHKSAKEESKDIRNRIDYLEDKGIKAERDQLVIDKSHHDKDLDRMNKLLSNLTDKKEEIESEIELLKNRKFHIDDDVVDVSTNITTCKKQIDTIESQIDIIKDNLSKDMNPPQNILDDIQGYEKELKNLKENGTSIKTEDEKQKEKQISDIVAKGKKIAGYIKDLENNIEEKENSFDDEFDIEEAKQKLEKLKSKKEELLPYKYTIDDLKNKISEAEKQSEVLSKDDRFENEELCQSCPLLSSAFDSKENIYKYKIKLTTAKRKVEELGQVIEDISKYESVIGEYDEISFSIQTLKNDLKTQKEKRSELLSVHKGYTEDLENIRSSKKELIESKIDSLESKIQSKRKEAKEAISEKVNELKGELKDKEFELKNKQKELSELKEKQEKFEEKQMKIKENEKVDLEIDKKRKGLSEITESIKSHDDDIIEIKTKIGTIENKIRELDEEYYKLKTLKADYIVFDKYIKGTHKNNIPLQVISNMLDVIQNEINGVLTNVVNFKLKLFIEDDNVICNIIDDRGEREASRLSGMERFISNLAFRISIAQIGNMSVSKLLSIDEGLSALDSTTSQEIPRLFSYLKTKFHNIFVVSHHESMRDMVDYNVEIDTSDIKSRIYED